MQQSIHIDRILTQQGGITMMNDILEVMRHLVSRFQPDKEKSSLLIKAIISNFMISGIIDSNGCFKNKAFISAYGQGKLKIGDLRLIIGV
jgi:hypothetical protein